MFKHEIAEPGQLAVEPRWLHVEPAAKYACVSRAQLYLLLSTGQIKSASVSARGHLRGRRVVDRLSIDRYLESRLTPWTTAQSLAKEKTPAKKTKKARAK